MDYIKKPMVIEEKSFEIITKELGEKINEFTFLEQAIVKRVIHTTADFDYANIIKFVKDPIKNGIEALKSGCKIYCDTNMIVNGLSKVNLNKLSCTPYCLVSDKEVVVEAKKRGVTRSIVAMEKALEDKETEIFIIGNAPTALYTLMEAIKEKGIVPKLIIGVPVGFVGAAESKRDLLKMNLPSIIIEGRKGGSTVAVSILHGILYEIVDRS